MKPIQLIEKYVCSNFIELSTLKNGNYVVQQVLNSSHDDVKVQLLQSLVDNFTVLSLNKYGSNVTQVSLKLPCISYIELVTEELISDKKLETNYMQ